MQAAPGPRKLESVRCTQDRLRVVCLAVVVDIETACAPESVPPQEGFAAKLIELSDRLLHRISIGDICQAHMSPRLDLSEVPFC